MGDNGVVVLGASSWRRFLSEALLSAGGSATRVLLGFSCKSFCVSVAIRSNRVKRTQLEERGEMREERGFSVEDTEGLENK